MFQPEHCYFDRSGDKWVNNWLGASADSPRMGEWMNTDSRARIEISCDDVAAKVASGEWESEVLECLDGPAGCSGKVEWHSVSGYGNAFPRCAGHWSKRLDKQAHINELTSATPAAWFDPSFAGERWDDDY